MVWQELKCYRASQRYHSHRQREWCHHGCRQWRKYIVGSFIYGWKQHFCQVLRIIELHNKTCCYRHLSIVAGELNIIPPAWYCRFPVKLPAHHIIKAEKDHPTVQ